MPQTKKSIVVIRFIALLAFPSLVALLSGCGTGLSKSATPAAPVTPFTYSGRIMGGQQPVVGATINLYAVAQYVPGQPDYDQPVLGYGAATTPLLASTVTTDAQGQFNITGVYNCSATDLVYITATGGNPGGGSNNSNLALMAAGLGPCSDTVPYPANPGYTLHELKQGTYIEINELTTVASVYALSAFMTGPANIGASANNSTGLQQAFADVSQLVDTTAGSSPGPALPSGATLPVAEMNSLANILAACINSSGVPAVGPSTCGTLFAAATPAGGTAPTDTITAMVNIAQHPGQNVAALFALASSTSPFQPALTSPPNDWTLAVDYSAGGVAHPSSLAIDASGNIWISSLSSNSVGELAHNGQAVAGSPFAASIQAPAVIALDQSGIPWVAGSNNTVTQITATGTPAVLSGGGLNAPAALAFDPQGNLWVADGGSNAVSQFSSAGSPASASGFTGTGIVKPLGIAISPQ